MDKKKIIILAVAVIVIILLLVWFFRGQQQQDLNIISDVSEPVVVVDDLIDKQLDQLPSPSPKTVKSEQNYSLGLKQLAFSFTERYGSYSNHDNFKSLRDLSPLVTPKMQRYIDTVISSGGTDMINYEGFSTKALSSELQEFDQSAGRARILVKAQRSKYVNDDDRNVFYQNLLLDFIMVNGEWRVDDAWWSH